MTKATAAIAYAPNRPLVIEDVVLKRPGPAEVLVELKAAGLCHSDLSWMEGGSPLGNAFPVVLGHEGAGIVLEVGAGVKNTQVGDHVIAFAPECRQCGACHDTRGNICDDVLSGYGSSPSIKAREVDIYAGFGLGTFATHMVTTESRLAVVRKDAPFDQIAYLSCGATTGIGAALVEAKVAPNSSVVVFGLGGIGLNIIQGARLAGASTIIGVDTNEDKAAIAYRLGATDFVNPATVGEDLVGCLREMTSGGADYTFEAIGSVKVMQYAIAVARIGWGVCTIVGVPRQDQAIEVMPMDLLLGRKLQGTSMGGMRGRRDLPGLVDRMMAGDFSLEELISERLALADINSGYDHMKAGTTIRSVIVF